MAYPRLLEQRAQVTVAVEETTRAGLAALAESRGQRLGPYVRKLLVEHLAAESGEGRRLRLTWPAPKVDE